MTYQVKSIKCGKKGCKSCPHSYYVYGFWKENGKTKSKYIGKLGVINLEELKNEELKKLEEKWKGSWSYGGIYYREEKSKLLKQFIKLENLLNS
jgi:hypothetical protein